MITRGALQGPERAPTAGFPDSPLPSAGRKLYAVSAPAAHDRQTPTISQSARRRRCRRSDREGFQLGYCKAKPGKGPLMHNHDTNETSSRSPASGAAEWNEAGDGAR